MTKQSKNKATSMKVDKSFPVAWHYPPDLITQYATNMIVQHTEREFILSFFEAYPPVLFSKEDISKVDRVDATCIARIVVFKQSMGDFLDILKQSYDRSIAKEKSNVSS